jgi:hypothetical protein
MERGRHRVEKAIEHEFSGTHSVVIGEHPTVRGVFSIVIKDGYGNIVTRDHPMFSWEDVQKWSDEELRGMIRTLEFGHP